MFEEVQDYIRDGRKTFFIAPDVSLLPESFLEDFMLHGFETYLIREDRLCSLEIKIEILVNLFPDLILFIYIDNNVEQVDWKVIINRLQNRFGDNICIGVLYANRKTDQEKKKLEKQYLFDCGVQGGCIALEFQKEKNFPRLDQVLAANQASGRRKHIRAICNGSSKVVFMHKGEKYSGTLLDVSDSHFSCTINQEDFDIQMYEKIPEMLLEFNGLYIRSDATLSFVRRNEGKIIYVFVFVKQNGTNGLEKDLEVRLIRKIYSIISTKINSMLNALFIEATRRYRKLEYITYDDLQELLKDYELKEESSEQKAIRQNEIEKISREESTNDGNL